MVLWEKLLRILGSFLSDLFVSLFSRFFLQVKGCCRILIVVLTCGWVFHFWNVVLKNDFAVWHFCCFFVKFPLLRQTLLCKWPGSTGQQLPKSSKGSCTEVCPPWKSALWIGSDFWWCWCCCQLFNTNRPSPCPIHKLCHITGPPRGPVHEAASWFYYIFTTPFGSGAASPPSAAVRVLTRPRCVQTK